MYDLLVGSVILWALGRVVKKKADAPAPGTIAPPAQQRMAPGVTPNNRPVGPANTTSGAPGKGRPGIL
jgi:hypothetical protein